MALESNHDLPADILEKLQNLELELEEGDITLKGFEKKKANLLASFSPVPTSPQQDEAAILAELGPEPSAADVTDFLDFLPSPTHSPTRNEGAALMEENYKQQQQQQQPYQQPQQPQTQPQYLQQQSYQNYSQQQQQQQQQQQYQQHQYQQTYQNDVYHQGSPQLRHNVPGQYRPYPQMAVGGGGGGGGGNNGRPINNNPIYYNNNPNNPTGSPIPNNRPYMVGRPQQRPPPGSNPYNGYVAGNNGYAPYRPNGSPQYNPSRPSLQPQPQSQQQAQQQQQQQHMYNSPRPLSTSPRPIYRPNPNNPAMYNYRPTAPGYANQRPPPPPVNDPYYSSVNRSLSTSSGINTMAKQRQGYTDRHQHSMSMYSTGSESEWNQ